MISRILFNCHEWYRCTDEEDQNSALGICIPQPHLGVGERSTGKHRLTPLRPGLQMTGSQSHQIIWAGIE